MNKFLQGTRKRVPFFLSIILFAIALEGLSWIWLYAHENSESKKWQIDWELISAPVAKFPGAKDLFTSSLSKQIFTSPEGRKKEILYSINEYGLRDPSPDPQLKKSHLFLSGDSYVFGQAIPENETISSQLSRLHPEIRVSNMGWPGGSMHTALRLFDLINPRDFAREDQGIMIYVFVNFHVLRWLKKPAFYRWSVAHTPIYREENGKFIYQGKLGEEWMYKFIKILPRSAFGKILLDQLVKIGRPYHPKDLEKYFNAVAELKRRYLAMYPRGRFIVLTHPLQSNERFIPGVKKEAHVRGIECFDSIPEWKATHSGEHKLYTVPGDGHPNGQVNEFLAQFISQKILSSEGPVKR